MSTISSFHYNGKQEKKVPRFDIFVVDKIGLLLVIGLKTGLSAIDNGFGIDVQRWHCSWPIKEPT